LIAVNLLIDFVKDTSKPVVMDDFQSRFPTNILDVAKVLKQIVERSDKLSGIFHLSAKERATKYEICKVFSEILRVNIDHITPNRNAPTDPIATRPNDCQLLPDKLEKAGIDISCQNFKTWFQEYLNKI
jgi:S-adenosylmethionine synthetase